MLRWRIDKNVIAELYHNGNNIINPWGFETADSSAFFSLEKGVGWRHQKLAEDYYSSDQTYNAKITTQMKEGKWELVIADHIQDNTIVRKVEAVTLKESVFMDFVMRFRFKKEFIEYAEIADHRYHHHDTNVYYQYPVDHVFLKGIAFNVKISVIDMIVPSKMESVIYVRDHEGEWVVHVRMVPREWDKEVIKLCTAWAETRPLPQWISKPLLRLSGIKEILWYRGERSPFKSWVIRRSFNPSAYGMVSLPKGERLMWHVKMDIV
jgi:hypothetical protein